MRLIRFYLPAAIWMLVIFIFSSRQRLQVSEVYLIQFAFFKMLHVLEYGFLWTLWYRAMRNTTRLSYKTIVIVSTIISVLYAVSDELHQAFVPTREGRSRDIGIDMIGIFMAWGGIWYIQHKAPKRLKNWANNWQLV